MTADQRTTVAEWRHITALAAGLLLAPFAAMLHLELGYAGVRHACRTASENSLHLETVVLLALALLGAAIAWRIWRRASQGAAAGDPRSSRDRFLGAAGLGLGLLFALVIVAQWLPVFQLSPCQ